MGGEGVQERPHGIAGTGAVWKRGLYFSKEGRDVQAEGAVPTWEATGGNAA